MTALIDHCSDFICSHWGADHCDPNSWSYEPSTYDVEDVEIVVGPHMKAWSDLESWVNPGRANGVDTGKVQQLCELSRLSAYSGRRLADVLSGLIAAQ